MAKQGTLHPHVYHPDFDREVKSGGGGGNIAHAEIAVVAADEAVTSKSRDYFGDTYTVYNGEAQQRLFRLMNYALFRADKGDGASWLSLARQVRDELVRCNYGLVKKYLRRHCPKSLRDERRSDCMIILLRAIDSYDFTRGYSVSTYLYTAIRRGMARIVSKDVKRVRATKSSDGVIRVCENRDIARIEDEEFARALVRSLDPETASCVERRCFGDMTFKDIGEGLKLTTEAARKRWRKGLKAMRAKAAVALAG